MLRCLLFCLCALALPGSVLAKPNLWDLIASVEFQEVKKDGRWTVEKTFPAGLRAGEVEVTGYFVPVMAQAYIRSFLLVPDPADCPFCGSSGYGPSLEVHMRKSMPDMAEGSRIRIRGRLHLIESGDTYDAVLVTDAILLD